MAWKHPMPTLGAVPKPRSLTVPEAERQIREENRSRARRKAREARQVLIEVAALLDDSENPEAHRRCMESIDYVDGLLSAIRGDEEE